MTILVLLAGYAVENVSGMPYSKYMEKTFSPVRHDLDECTVYARTIRQNGRSLWTEG